MTQRLFDLRSNAWARVHHSVKDIQKGKCGCRPATHRRRPNCGKAMVASSGHTSRCNTRENNNKRSTRTRCSPSYDCIRPNKQHNNNDNKTGEKKVKKRTCMGITKHINSVRKRNMCALVPSTFFFFFLLCALWNGEKNRCAIWLIVLSRLREK